jgi:hypothetical protein
MTLQILVVLESLTQAFQADGDSWSKLHLQSKLDIVTSVILILRYNL